MRSPLSVILLAAALPAQGSLFFDIDPGPPSGIPGQFVPARVGQRIVFPAQDGRAGREPWVTDGSAAGTALLSDLNPGADPSSVDVWSIGSRAVISSLGRRAPDFEFWSTDGTAGGTRLLSTFPRVFQVATLPERLLIPSHATNSSDLWVTDGSQGGTRRLASFAPTNPGPLDWITRSGSLVFFDDGPNLWQSDGTTAGTRRFPGASPSNPTGAYGVNHALFLWAPSFNGFDSDLYVVTRSGGPAIRILPNHRTNYQEFAWLAGGLWLFTHDDGIHGLEPWLTDGTVSGTRLLADLFPGPIGGNASFLAEVDGGALFWSRTAQNTLAALFVDAAGTLVGPIANMSFSPAATVGPFEVLSPDRVLTHAVSVQGTTWSIDTTRGVGQLLFRENYLGLAISGSKLLYGRIDPYLGSELFQWDVGATSTRIGMGCGSGLREPRLEATSPRIGQSFVLSISGPASPRLLTLGPPLARPASFLGICTVFVDLARGAAWPLSNLATFSRQSLTVPNDPGLVGTEWAAQVWFASPSSPRNLEGTNGVLLTIGR